MYKVIFPLLAFLVASCASEPKNGGPCEYEIDTVPATIVRMDSTDSPYPEIVLTVPSKLNGTDTLLYTYYAEESPTWEVATERGYSVGARLKCIREYRTSGHCDPEIFVVKKELYR